MAELNSRHGITLENMPKHRTSPPTLARFEKPVGSTESSEFDAWIVLDEGPDSSSQGDVILYDPSVSMFGLAHKNDPMHTIIGCIESFIATIRTM